MVEQFAVNEKVAGSNPASGAKPSSEKGRPCSKTGSQIHSLVSQEKRQP